MASNSLFLNIATILWAANISSRKDEGGNPIVPDTLEAIPGLAMLVSPLSSPSNRLLHLPFRLDTRYHSTV